MRNQINISKINVEKKSGHYRMQSSVTKSYPGTNVVGELPILLKIKSSSDWDEHKVQILTYCFQEMEKKDQRNVVVLYDSYTFDDVGIGLKLLMKDKTVVEYPSGKGKQKDISNIKDFIEKDDHILLTKSDYFNGCEASNIVFLNNSTIGWRNSFMRGVKNLILVEVHDIFEEISGMKEDKRFY